MRNEIGALTGLRGVAALWVLLLHALPLLDPAREPLLRSVFELLSVAGYLGVDIFFVLSGFVIAHNYSHAGLHRSVSGYGKFLWKRLARVYPVHLATLFVVGAVVALLASAGVPYLYPGLFSADGLWRSIALVHAWSYPVESTWNAASWSLSCEWAAYLAFPLIAASIVKIRSTVVALLVIGALYASMFGIISGSGMTGSVAFGMLRIAVGFTSGVLLHHIWNMRHRPTAASGDWLAFVGLLLMIVGGNLYDVLQGQEASMPVMPILSCAVVYGLATAGGALPRLMATQPMQYLGRISYALYMVHTIIIRSVRSVIAAADDDMTTVVTIVVLVASLLASLAMAHLLYTFVESPARRWMLNTRWHASGVGNAAVHAQSSSGGRE